MLSRFEPQNEHTQDGKNGNGLLAYAAASEAVYEDFLTGQGGYIGHSISKPRGIGVIPLGSNHNT